MYQRIVVALDGSETAEQILPHVETLASRFGAAVTLVRATSLVEPALAAEAGVGSGFADPTPLLEAQRSEARKYLDQVAERLRSVGISVTCDQPESRPAEAILDAVQRVNADLLALTTHGRSGLGRLVFGSVADEVLHKAACAVLLVRAS